MFVQTTLSTLHRRTRSVAINQSLQRCPFICLDAIISASNETCAKRSSRDFGTVSFGSSHQKILAHQQKQHHSLLRLRYFSTDDSNVSAADDLMDKLSREHDEELENGNTNMPEDLVGLKTKIEKEGNWTIIDGSVTKLKSTKGGFSVVLSFHCQDTVPPEDDHEQPENDDDDAGDEDSVSVRFTVTAAKGPKAFVFQCIAHDATVSIDAVSIGDSADADKIHDGKVDNDNEYQGPEFSELAEDLKDAFADFLNEDLCVNDDMSAFVAMYTDYKEQGQYVQFLKNAKDILK